MRWHDAGYRLGYSLAYRLGFTPWEHHAATVRESVDHLLAREEVGRSGRPLGRALDLGCGRGHYTDRLARRGWESVGIDTVPLAIESARQRAVPGTSFVVGDVTAVADLGLGTFDLFLDVGCFQGLQRDQRRATGAGVSAIANSGATLLMLAFGATRMRTLVGGVSQEEVEEAFPGWILLSIDEADTRGLGWPLTRTAPRWYRLQAPGGAAA